MKRLLVLVAVLGFSRERGARAARPARRRPRLPSAPRRAEPTPSPSTSTVPRAGAGATRRRSRSPLAGKSLRLNGRRRRTATRPSGDGGALKIVKYVLPGEVISHPSQKCRIDIVSETPIEAVSKGAAGRPAALRRRHPRLPADLRRRRRRRAGAAAGQRLRVLRRRLPGEPERAVGAAGVGTRREGDLESARRRRPLDPGQPARFEEPRQGRRRLAGARAERFRRRARRHLPRLRRRAAARSSAPRG